MATPCTNSLGGESEGHKHEGCGGRRLCWNFAAVAWSGAGGRSAVDVEVGPERRSPRYHETCLVLESVKKSSATVLEPRCVWLRVLIFKDLEKARRLSPRTTHSAQCALSTSLKCTSNSQH